MPSLSEINSAIRSKMAWSAKRVKITDFFKKSNTGDDQNTLSRSNLDQAVENVEADRPKCFNR